MNPDERKRRSVKNRAKRRGIEFALSIDVIRRLNSAPICGYCGIEFGASVPRSIERIDALLGYIPENVAAVCIKCNENKGCSQEDRHRGNRRKKANI